MLLPACIVKALVTACWQGALAWTALSAACLLATQVPVTPPLSAVRAQQPSAGALFAPATQQTGDTPQAAPAASPAAAPAGSNMTQLGSSSGSSSSTGSRGAAPTEPTAGGASATTAAPSPVSAATGANTVERLSWADRAKRAPAHPPQPQSPLCGAGSQAVRQVGGPWVKHCVLVPLCAQAASSGAKLGSLHIASSQLHASLLLPVVLAC